MPRRIVLAPEVRLAIEAIAQRESLERRRRAAEKRRRDAREVERRRRARPFAMRIVAWARAVAATGALRALPEGLEIYRTQSGREKSAVWILPDGSLRCFEGNYMAGGLKTYRAVKELVERGPEVLAALWAHIDAGGVARHVVAKASETEL